MTLSLKVIYLLRAFSDEFFIQLCNSLQDFDWHNTSCCSFVIAELVDKLILDVICGLMWLWAYVCQM